MTSTRARLPARALGSVSRVMGIVEGAGSGPTIVALGGLHGNEPAGVVALEQILDGLDARRTELSGTFVAVSGNRVALARGRRFVERDLNRVWTSGRVDALRTDPGAGGTGAEEREQIELLETLEAVAKGAGDRMLVLDLHTTSSMSGPWITVEDKLASRTFARRFPVPVILGLEERLQGTLLEHVGRWGHVGIGVEGGQHEDSRSVDRLRAAIWTGLSEAGMLGPAELPEVTESRALLEADAAGMPRVLEVRHRHGIHPGDGFRMRPGYVNLQPVVRGEILADHRGGEIPAPDSGRLLMPLYQQQGDDGFFIVRAAAAAGEDG